MYENDFILGFHSEKLKDYKIIEEIGEGGSSHVYSAYYDNMMNQKRIIKVSKNIGSDDGMQEAAILKNLRHSNIPIIYEYYVEEGRAILITEHFEGSSVQAMLNAGYVFNYEEVYRYGVQLAETVKYLHNLPIPVIHGDIKPDNIIVRPSGNISLIDFNISSVSMDGKAYTNGFTRGFGAPEQAEGFKRVKELQAQMVERKKERLLESNETKDLLKDDSTELLDQSNDANITLVDDYYGTPEDNSFNTGFIASQIIGEPSLGTKSESIEYNEIETSTPLPRIEIDKRSDVYSIGATLFRMFYSYRDGSQGHENRIDKYFAAGNEKVAGKGVHEGILFVIDKACQYEPDKRYQSAGDMLKALKKLKPQNRYERVAGMIMPVWALGTILAGISVAALVGIAILLLNLIKPENDHISKGTPDPESDITVTVASTPIPTETGDKTITSVPDDDSNAVSLTPAPGPDPVKLDSRYGEVLDAMDGTKEGWDKAIRRLNSLAEEYPNNKWLKSLYMECYVGLYRESENEEDFSKAWELYNGISALFDGNEKRLMAKNFVEMHCERYLQSKDADGLTKAKKLRDENSGLFEQTDDPDSNAAETKTAIDAAINLAENNIAGAIRALVEIGDIASALELLNENDIDESLRKDLEFEISEKEKKVADRLIEASKYEISSEDAKKAYEAIKKDYPGNPGGYKGLFNYYISRKNENGLKKADNLLTGSSNMFGTEERDILKSSYEGLFQKYLDDNNDDSFKKAFAFVNGSNGYLGEEDLEVLKGSVEEYLVSIKDSIGKTETLKILDYWHDEAKLFDDDGYNRIKAQLDDEPVPTPYVSVPTVSYNRDIKTGDSVVFSWSAKCEDNSGAKYYDVEIQYESGAKWNSRKTLTGTKDKSLSYTPDKEGSWRIKVTAYRDSDTHKDSGWKTFQVKTVTPTPTDKITPTPVPEIDKVNVTLEKSYNTGDAADFSWKGECKDGTGAKYYDVEIEYKSSKGWTNKKSLTNTTNTSLKKFKLENAGPWRIKVTAYMDSKVYKDSGWKTFEVSDPVPSYPTINGQKAEPGDVVSFGAYEWYVFTEPDRKNSVLLVSRNSVSKTARQFSSDHKYDWETSTNVKYDLGDLRYWLNHDFYEDDKVFAEKDRKKMVDMGMGNGSAIAGDGRDMVSIPTIDQWNTFKKGIGESKLVITDTDDKKNYWLRKQGEKDKDEVQTAYYHLNGSKNLNQQYDKVTNTKYVRAVIRVKIDK